MLTKDQKLILAKHVLAKKDILFAKHNPSITNKIKDKHWQEIFHNLVANGAQIKSLEYLRKTDWGNLKRTTIEKYVASKKSGEGGLILSQTEKLVMETEGYDSVNVNALNIKDMAVNLGKKKAPTTKFNPPPSTLDLNGTSYQSDDIEFAIDEEYATGKDQLIFIYIFKLPLNLFQKDK